VGAHALIASYARIGATANNWLLSARKQLVSGAALDLGSAPVKWIASSLKNQLDAAFGMTSTKGRVVIIRKWKNDAHAFARSLGGSFASMEEVDCNDLLEFAGDLDTMKGTARAARVIRFGAECITEVSTALATPLAALDRGELPSRGRNTELAEVVAALSAVAQSDAAAPIRVALHRIEKIPGAKIFRRELWREAGRTIEEFERGSNVSLRGVAWTIRNRQRYAGRPVDPRCVSRTLLIKGLEFDHALVLDAAEFTDGKHVGDGAKHFYVAITRGAQSLVVLSKQPVIKFSAPVL
jgi:hypothetical protein